MQSLWQDLRYGMRGIRGNPGFSLLAILTLALGIGAGTTMFSVIKNVLLSPFPYKDATRIAAAASLAANKVLASELWGVTARDPLTFAVVALGHRRLLVPGAACHAGGPDDRAAV
jgi:hypothetical protein